MHNLLLNALVACALLQLGMGVAAAAPFIEATNDGLVLHVDEAQSVAVQTGSGGQFSIVTSQEIGQLGSLLTSDDDDGPDSTLVS